MRTLPLYPDAHKTRIETVKPLALDKDCRRCRLGGVGRTTCLSAEGIDGADSSVGTLLIIGDAPTLEEDRVGRPFVDEHARRIRKWVPQHWSGNVVLDYATRCTSLRGVEDPLAAEKCAPYLRGTFIEAAPERVVILGHKAAQAVLGRYIPPLDARRNYSWLKHPSGKLVPAFVLQNPADANRNKHLRRWFQEDLNWACTATDLMPPPYDAKFHIVENMADALEAAEALRRSDWLAYDCETAGKHYSSFFRIVAVSCTPADEDTAYVWGRKALADDGARAVLLDLMEDRTVGKAGHNIKYDALSLRAAYGVVARPNTLDTQLTRHLEFPGCDATLEVCSELVGMGGYKQEFGQMLAGTRAQIRNARKKSNGNRQLWLTEEDAVLVAAVENAHEEVDVFSYGLIRSPDLERYNARDTIATARLARSRSGFDLVRKHAPSRNIWKNVVSKATDAIEQIEAWGIPASREGIGNFRTYVDNELTEVRARFDRYNVNLDSPQQVAALLFERLRLKNPHDVESRSTDKHALKAMKEMHPVVGDLIEYRRLSKLRSAYGDLDKFIRSDGRIHPSLKIDGTETGRLSCVDPGLHQIPRGEDSAGNKEGKLLKGCFAAKPGYRIFQHDYSQLEYRVAAIESGDKVMRDMFLTGADFHMSTAKLIAPLYWHIKPEEVGKAHRSETKAFNFGLLYGQQDMTIAATLKIAVEQAAKLRQTIMGQWADLDRWIKEQIEYAERTGTACTTWLGAPARIRQIYNIGNIVELFPDKKARSIAAKTKVTARNGSFNGPIQGKASDFMLCSLGQLVPMLARGCGIDAQVCLTVHDSVIAHVREDQAAQYDALVRGIMTTYETNGVPIVVDAEWGDSWGDLEKFKP